ncbi:MAG: SiaB family protein kinase [Bacteroidota bacterium]|nr:SiaB family protein kinase [Bacteroidota bacterium]
MMKEIDLNFVPAIHKKMFHQHYMLCYKGHFSQDVTKSLLTMAENKLEKEGTETAIKKKIFNIMMGCLQNICMTETTTQEENPSAIFMLGKNDQEFFIFSGKVIPNEQVDEMKRKLYAINMMDSEDLKNLFTSLIKSLSASEISESEVTLIDIARKSGKKLEFNFHEINDLTTFFSMRTVIARFNKQ